MTLDIAGHLYTVVTLTGRLFLNGVEFRAIVDHDSQEIRISSLVAKAERDDLIAEAAAQTFRRRIMDSVHGRLRG